jgi:hypothetical protein
MIDGDASFRRHTLPNRLLPHLQQSHDWRVRAANPPGAEADRKRKPPVISLRLEPVSEPSYQHSASRGPRPPSGAAIFLSGWTHGLRLRSASGE